MMDSKPLLEEEPSLHQMEASLRREFRSQVTQLRLEEHEGGLILSGQAYTFHAKQLIQHAVIHRLRLRILANRIQVS